MMKLVSADLILRCFAERAEGQWQAVCVDLCLAAQGDTLQEAREKLHAMIAEYVYDALAGEDRAFADQLLVRRAPLSILARYHWLGLLARFGALRESVRTLFTESLPLVPQG
jgi:predicted RNase H-like HicB family nuclease